MTLMSASALVGTAGIASAQTQGGATPHVQLQKTIGQAKPDIVPSLIVMNSRGATLQGGKLVPHRHVAEFDHFRRPAGAFGRS